MRRPFLTTLATLLALLAAWGSGPPAQAARDFDIHIRYLQRLRNPPQHGQLRRVQVLLRNTTSRVLIVRGIRFQNRPPDTRVWLGSRYGSATYDAGANKWVVNPLSQMLSQPVFVNGIVPPGQTIRIDRWLRLVDVDQPIEIDYQSLTTQQAAKALYLPPEGAGDLAREYLPAPRSWPKKAVETRGLSGILGHAKAGKRKSIKGRMEFAFPQPKFTVNQARAKADMRGAAYTYWTSARGWVLRKGGRTVSVTPNATRSLPDGDLTIYDVFDQDVATRDERQARVLIPATGFDDIVAPAKPRIEGPGYFRLGLTSVNHGTLRALLDRCRERGLKAVVRVLNPNGLQPRAVVCLGAAGTADDLSRRRREARSGE